jgi:phosphatidylserine decarboxylase
VINWKAPLPEIAFAMLQHLLPQHLLSSIAHRMTRSRCPVISRPVIRLLVRKFNIDLGLAEDPVLEHYPTINAFFTRALRPDARPIDPSPDTWVSPADGVISECGSINGDSLLQAKGQTFSLLTLLGGDEQLAAQYADGSFTTIYLSPRDYHRLHMPLAGSLSSMSHIPGKLFSVNQATANTIPSLFARNERVIACFDTEAGPMALILVGAIFVGSIETVWHGEVTPPTRSDIRQWFYQGEECLQLGKGEEMGRFNMGSTIIVLFGKDRATLDEGLQAGSPVRMGKRLGKVQGIS